MTALGLSSKAGNHPDQHPGPHRLGPGPETAHVVQWMFAQRLAGHPVARIARALSEAGIPWPWTSTRPAGAEPGLWKYPGRPDSYRDVGSHDGYNQ
jgi:hypothetical protein